MILFHNFFIIKERSCQIFQISFTKFSHYETAPTLCLRMHNKVMFRFATQTLQDPLLNSSNYWKLLSTRCNFRYTATLWSAWHMLSNWRKTKQHSFIYEWRRVTVCPQHLQIFSNPPIKDNSRTRWWKRMRPLHCKKVDWFSYPKPGCHLPYSLTKPGIIKLFPASESLEGDMPAGDGKNS